MAQASEAPVATTEAASSRRWWTLVTVALAQLMVVLDATVVNIALPQAQDELGFTDGEREWVITAYSLAFGSLLLFFGRLSDIIGRKRTFLIGLIGFAGASAIGGAAVNFEMLVAARALQGAFGAVLAPTALAVLTTTFTIPKERARAFGVFGAIAGAGGAIGLLLGGFLTQNFSWRWNLYINVVIAIVGVIGAIFLVHNVTLSGPRPRLDVPGAVLVSGGLFLLVFGFSNAESEGWGSPLTWGMLVGSGVLLIAFVLWQRVAKHPLLPLSIVTDRNRAASYSSVLIVGACLFGIFLFVTFYLQTSLGYTPIQTGVAFLPMTLSLVLAAQLSTNFFLPRLGPKLMVPFGHDARRDRHGALHTSQCGLHVCGGHPAAPHHRRVRHRLDRAGVDPDRDTRRRRTLRRRRLGDGEHEPAGRRVDRHCAAQHHRRECRDCVRRGPRATHRCGDRGGRDLQLFGDVLVGSRILRVRGGTLRAAVPAAQPGDFGRVASTIARGPAVDDSAELGDTGTRRHRARRHRVTASRDSATPASPAGGHRRRAGGRS